MISPPNWHKYHHKKYPPPQENNYDVLGFNFWPGYLGNTEYPFGFLDIVFRHDTMLSKTKTEMFKMKWCVTDNFDIYQKNLLEMQDDWHYATQKVEYEVNQHGFRTKNWADINWKESIVILGDSCTFGVGVDQTETISYQLEKMLGRPVVNLGVPAGSNDLILQNSSTILNHFGEPWAVVIIWSTTDRFRYFYQHGFRDVGPWIAEIPEFQQKENGVNLYDLWAAQAIDPFNRFSRQYYNAQMAKAMFKNLKDKYINISFYEESALVARADHVFCVDNQARDLVHPGPEQTLEVAEYLYEKFNQ